MFHWNTDKIIKDLDKMPLVSSILRDCGGDYDTDNLVIFVKGTKERLFVLGFNDDDFGIHNPSDADVSMIELTDGEDSRGGLNSSEPNTAQAFIAVRQYFIDQDATVVNCMKEYF